MATAVLLYFLGVDTMGMLMHMTQMELKEAKEVKEVKEEKPTKKTPQKKK
ncbi:MULTISPECIES: hypothetical protein [Gammaproteobacteria]